MDARLVVMQYLCTAELWRYDRVLWAFNIMSNEIPEDSPEPPSPYDPDFATWYPQTAHFLSANTEWYDQAQKSAREHQERMQRENEG
jgi:hypothetical protein